MLHIVPPTSPSLRALNMGGLPGALQVLAALLHGVQNDNRQLTVHGTLDLTAIQVRNATAMFHQALVPLELWVGSLPVCQAEYHEDGYSVQTKENGVSPCFIHFRAVRRQS